jgi:hypothetical protein
MFESVESIVLDLESSIKPPATIEEAEQAQRALEKSARPPWTVDSPFDCDAVIKAGLAGEVLPANLSGLRTTDPLTARVAELVRQELKRVSKTSELLEDNLAHDEPREQEEPPADPPADLHADIAFLKAKAAEGVALWSYTSQVLESDYARGKQLRRALAYLCDEMPALLDAA